VYYADSGVILLWEHFHVAEVKTEGQLELQIDFVYACLALVCLTQDNYLDRGQELSLLVVASKDNQPV